MSKHTPGPWDTWASAVMQSIGVTGPTAAASMTATADISARGYASFAEVLTHGQKVAAIALGTNQEEATHNANLIAAAPELLSFVERYIEHFEAHDITNTNGCNVDATGFLEGLARAAIAKATGEAA